MKESAPIKRHPALVSFSKEHHFGLLLVWKIRQGLDFSVSPDRIARYILYFFDVDLKSHFRDEETFLFPCLPAGDSLRVQAESEHARIYGLVQEIAAAPGDAILLRSFAEMLEKHIRFEERILFNHLQSHLGAEELEEISKRLPASADPDLQWEDKFWVK